MKFAVYGITKDIEYAPFAPITAKIWRKMGYDSIVFAIGNREEWGGMTGDVLRVLDSIGVRYYFVDMEGVQCSRALASKLVRYAACFLPWLEDHDYLLTTDADMLPLDYEWFTKGDPERMTFWNANANGYRQHAACFIGGPRKTWESFNRSLGSFSSVPQAIAGYCKLQAERAASWGGWNSDELMFSDFWKRWLKYPHDCRMVESDLSKTRIDRAQWPRPFTVKGKKSAHLPRPMRDGRAWKRIRSVIESVAPEELEWCDDYYKLVEPVGETY